MHLYQEQFSKCFGYDKVTKPTRFLIIDSTPRCGTESIPKEQATKIQSNRKKISYEKKCLLDYNGDELINVNIPPPPPPPPQIFAQGPLISVG